MPSGFPSAEYDTLRIKDPHVYEYSRALREFTIPVQATLKASRGIQIWRNYGGFPHPCRWHGCDDNYCGQELGQPMSTLALYVMDLVAEGGNPTLPPEMIIQIRQGTAMVTTVRRTIHFAPNTYTHKDLLLQVKGLTGTQWEIWTRIDPLAADAAPVRVALAAVLSSYDNKEDGQILGPAVVIGPP